MKYGLKAISLFIFCSNINYAQFDNSNFSLGAGIGYTTSVKYYPFPGSPQKELANYYLYSEDLISYMIEFKYQIASDVICGFNIERFTINFNTVESVLTLSGTRHINVFDEFEIYPIETNLYYIFPFSGERFEFTMGGGFGIYYTEYKRKYNGVNIAKLRKRYFSYGIQTSVGLSYRPAEYFNIKMEMRFKDPETRIKNEYTVKIIDLSGLPAEITRDYYTSMINIDGVSFYFIAAINL